uniref:Sodefrin-like factor n=1 Tax=Leptobrachium leishanense TaxID=445787 RepID=A0A8C5MWC2_9ANUR
MHAINCRIVAFSGHALSCVQCVSLGMNFCNGLGASCPSDHMCGATYVETTGNGTVFSRNYMRYCVPTKECNLQGSLSIINNIVHRLGTTCCETDNCTPTLPILPSANTRLNGLVCSTCVTSASKWCHTTATMKCTGNENMCALQSTTNEGNVSMASALRGCATKSLCDLGRQTAGTAVQKIDVKYTCSSGTAGLYSGLTLSFIAILINGLGQS